MNEGAGLGRRIHSGNLKPVQRFRWIGERNVHRADGVTGIAQEFPNCRRTARSGVRVLHCVAALLALDEIIDAVFARILAGHEGRPRGRRDWGHDRLERSRDAGFHQLRQIRHFSFRHQWPDNCPSCGVQADDDYLRNLLHVVSRLNVMPGSVKLCGRGSRWTFICKPSKFACRLGRIENRSLKFRVRSGAPARCAVC